MKTTSLRLVKLIDNTGKWNGETVGKQKGEGVHKFTVCGKAGGFGWNDKGLELYKTLRGCFNAIKTDHWENLGRSTGNVCRQRPLQRLMNGQQ